jgi:hypothetical protein
VNPNGKGREYANPRKDDDLLPVIQTLTHDIKDSKENPHAASPV